MRLKYLPFMMSIILTSVLFGQKTPQKSTWTGQLKYTFVPSIKEQIKRGTFISPSTNKNSPYAKDKKIKGNKVIPGKGLPRQFDPLLNTQKRSLTKKIKSTKFTFESTNQTDSPSDPTGAIGRDYYITAWNTAFRIFNKDGTPASEAVSLGTLFPGDVNGDPIVLYDSEADRYIITEFENNPNGFHIAISQTNDPVNGGWHTYSAESFQTGTFPDYTKFSIWSDAYYVTANISKSDDSNNIRNGQVWALERDKMLNGDSSASIQSFTLTGMVTNGFYSPQVFNVIDDNLPSNGNATLVYLQDDAWEGIDVDHLKLWTINIDWDNPTNSTISAPIEIPTAPFTSVFDGGDFSNLSQPTGPDIDAMQGAIMNQAHFKKFSTYNSAIFNFVVNTNTTNELAGIRWYELRQNADGQPWFIHQEGTYTAPDNRHAFGASMGIDEKGNIAMAYSSVSTDESISLRYTGRFHDDPLNVMTGQEELIVLSTSDNPIYRYADYSHLTVDPSNNSDFWFVGEYFNNGNRSNMVSVFEISEPLNNDIGISRIEAPTGATSTNLEEVTILITNYGKNSQSNFTISYSINGGAKITETFNNTLLPYSSAVYTFATTFDMSVLNINYEIKTSTELVGDENSQNDSKIINITNSNKNCVPEAKFGCMEDGIKQIILGDINVDNGEDGCNSTGNILGYVDRTKYITDLNRTEKHILEVQHNWSESPSGQAISVWIDYNDNSYFDENENVIKGEMFSIANSLEKFEFSLPPNANLGKHKLRIKAIAEIGEGDIKDPCGDYGFGEVHDYLVNIIDEKTNNNIIIKNSDLKVLTLSNKKYTFLLKTGYTGILTFRVYDILGKTIVYNNISKSGSEYRYDLDMSYASTGTYVIKIGAKSNYKEYKIIIK